VHLAGWPCDLDPLLDLAREHDLKLIEDCAQAHVARYKGRPVGSFGDAAAFSFCQDKIMTTGGEGGMLTTNDPELWERAWAYRDHGKSFEAVYRRTHPPDSAAARVVRQQLAPDRDAVGDRPQCKLDTWVAARRRHAAARTPRRDIPACASPSQVWTFSTPTISTMCLSARSDCVPAGAAIAL
jgi:dTDP-4-amino-4,6-dideoxygalactose transaminase